MERTYLGSLIEIIYFTIFQNILKFQKCDRLSYIEYTNMYPVISQFLQPEAEQLLLFRILLATVVLRTYFLKRSAACSWRLQVAIEHEVSIRNRDFKI